MDNIVSYYGKIHHDLRKLEQKDRERIKLIQSVTNLIHLQDEHFDLHPRAIAATLRVYSWVRSQHGQDAGARRGGQDARHGL